MKFNVDFLKIKHIDERVQFQIRACRREKLPKKNESATLVFGTLNRVGRKQIPFRQYVGM